MYSTVQNVRKPSQQTVRMRKVYLWMPAGIQSLFRRIRRYLDALQCRWRGNYCPVCKKSSAQFAPYGRIRRKNAQCPKCGALERHRLAWLFLQRMTDLFDGRQKDILHVAPESCFQSHLKEKFGRNYLTADLFNPRADEKMDLCDIDHPDETFDVIICIHVLEHIADDRRALRELFRVLRTNRWALINVPITRSTTFENCLLSDPKERLKSFGQENHVRRYGPDFVERLRESGFHVTIVKASEIASRRDLLQMGLMRHTGEIYFCEKQRSVVFNSRD